MYIYKTILARKAGQDEIIYEDGESFNDLISLYEYVKYQEMNPFIKVICTTGNNDEHEAPLASDSQEVSTSES